MTAPESILRLVERFDANRRAYTDAEIRILEGG